MLDICIARRINGRFIRTRTTNEFTFDRGTINVLHTNTGYHIAEVN